MAKRSAGLVMYRRPEDQLEVFLVHPGGPFWAKKDLGSWSISKGEYVEGELPLRSGYQIEIPEVDRGGWFSIAEAKERILKSQEPFLERLSHLLSHPETPGE
jgi:predicted NUDIX family NTP pyrophosphohydrolase